VTTDEIDRAVHQMIIDAGAYPSPLGYGGFPKSVCTSVNECICHGIPDSRALRVHIQTLLHLIVQFLATLSTEKCNAGCFLLILQDGDIINIDVTVYLNVCCTINLVKHILRCSVTCRVAAGIPW
jgi:methionine aminopeptidase